MAAAAPKPPPSTNGNGTGPDLETVRDQVRATLLRIKNKSKAGSLNEDSRLFKLKTKLTELGSEDDVDRRRRFLEEAEAEADKKRAYKIGSGVSKIPDPTSDD